MSTRNVNLRKKLFAFNTLSAIAKQIVYIVCGFILPRYILSYFGSEVNGLISSITQFLGFITFLEMGIGPVIQSNLYKPLAQKNKEDISKILASSERFFRRIAYIFLVYIVVLAFAFPSLINSSFDRWFTISLIIIISISTFAQYFFGITYQLLLNADQRAYVQLNLQTVTILLNTLVSIILMKCGCSIQTVKLATSIIYLLRPILQNIYVHRHYDIDLKIEYNGEPIKQKWNGFAQHLAGVVVANTDVTILTLCSSLSNVSIYSVYYSVVYGINTMVMTLVTGLEAIWGDMIAKKEMSKLQSTFEVVEWLMHVGCTLLFAITGILIVPFVRVYTLGINDANYIVPIFGAILVAAYGVQCLRVPYFRIIKAAGHYKETQNGSIIQMFLNIIISIALVFRFGLNGVAVGTLIAMFYHTTYFAWYLRKNILNRKFSYYIRHLFIDVLTVIICIIATRWVNITVYSYFEWIILAIKVCALCIVISVIINIVLNMQYCKKCISYFVKN